MKRAKPSKAKKLKGSAWAPVILKGEDAKIVAGRGGRRLASWLKDYKEGSIAKKTTTGKFRKAGAKAPVDTSKLPKNPEIWDRDFRGKSSGERDRELVEFLDRVYGPYVLQHRHSLREFISRTDPKLYRAITVYGFNRLPERLHMPSRTERLQELVKLAAEGGYKTMSTKEKRAVQWAASRSKPS